MEDHSFISYEIDFSKIDPNDEQLAYLRNCKLAVDKDCDESKQLRLPRDKEKVLKLLVKCASFASSFHGKVKYMEGGALLPSIIITAKKLTVFPHHATFFTELVQAVQAIDFESNENGETLFKIYFDDNGWDSFLRSAEMIKELHDLDMWSIYGKILMLCRGVQTP